MDTTKLTLIITSSALMQGCAALDTQPEHTPRFERSASFRYGNDTPLPELGTAREDTAEETQPVFTTPPANVGWAPEVTQKPKSKHKSRHHQNPIDAIESANQSARQSPDEASYHNAIMNYDYNAGALYQIHAAPLRLTDIQLEPGEEIIGKPAAGDTVRWMLGVNKSVENGLPRQHVLVKPGASGLTTTLIINTNRRTYLLELTSHKETYMAAVSWHYPQTVQRVSLDRLRAQALRQPASPGIDLDNLNFAYQVEPQTGNPGWTPTRVFDDGRRVFIRFPSKFQQGEAPALFVTSREGQAQMVNYRVRNSYYIVDRLFASAELRGGRDAADVVRISRQA
jgi:type IV secretion system protein VirB9